jgi:hypothetical protein
MYMGGGSESNGKRVGGECEENDSECPCVWYQPVVRHTTLKTTFTGLQHVLSTAETSIHQYRGIEYATIPARFRQSRLFTSYCSSTDAMRYGYVSLYVVLC